MPAYDPDRLDARDVALVRRAQPIARTFVRLYLRLRVDGTEHLRAAATRPHLLAANHNGGIAGPDVACSLSLLWDTLGPEAPVFALAHDFVMRHLPPIGRLVQRFGGLRATRANAARALAAGGSVLVYPGGDLDAYRHARRRNEIVFGGRHGFAHVARDVNVPILPLVAYGAHRSAYIVREGARLAALAGMKRWARVERFPIALALPYGVAVGPWVPYLPLPFQVRMRILPPVPPDAAPDAPSLAREVQARMQRAMDQLAAERA